MKKLKIITVIFLINTYETKALAQDLSSTPKKNYYIEAKSYSSSPESEPPRYVRQLDKTEFKALKNINWIDAGLQYRVRFEDRDGDFRIPVDTTDYPILSRTRAYFAIKNILDPLRFTLEFQDSRLANSKFKGTDKEVNKFDFIQSYAELYLKNIADRPLSLRAGRMSFEVLDRKLIARNEWRNTTNNFQGYRVLLGEKENDWQIDSFALQPVVRLTDKYDRRNNNQWFYGAILNWRRWSEIATLQPFYFRLDQNKTNSLSKRKIHSPGIRAYGTFGDSGFDYDFSGIYQFGENGVQKHRAYGYTTEIGYSFKKEWKPRLSLNYGYGSGDKNSSDNKNQRFERFFGFARPWSSNDYIQWENIKSLKSRIELKPNKKLQFDSGYSFYWLASKKDRWNVANLRDKSGNSGDFIGHELDFRALYKLTDNLLANIGYAHFTPGKFTRNTTRDKSSDFIYLELTWNLFK